MLMSIPIRVYIIQNMLIVWKKVLYILSHPYGNPSFKGVPDNIQLDFQPLET